MFEERNPDVRQAIKEAGLKHWHIAEALGISDGHFSRILRYEMSQEQKEEVFKAIKELENLKTAR